MEVSNRRAHYGYWLVGGGWSGNLGNGYMADVVEHNVHVVKEFEYPKWPSGDESTSEPGDVYSGAVGVGIGAINIMEASLCVDCVGGISLDNSSLDDVDGLFDIGCNCTYADSLSWNMSRRGGGDGHPGDDVGEDPGDDWNSDCLVRVIVFVCSGWWIVYAGWISVMIVRQLLFMLGEAFRFVRKLSRSIWPNMMAIEARRIGRRRYRWRRPRGRLRILRLKPRTMLKRIRRKSTCQAAMTFKWGKWIRIAAVLYLITCRIGEASNPGPKEGQGDGGGRGSAWMEAEMVEEEKCDAIVYPVPGREGFRRVTAPGFDCGLDIPRNLNEEDKEKYLELIVETVNTTGLGPLKRRLMATDSHILLVQETWALPHQVAAMSNWARRRGWTSLWAPATLGPGGGASGGTAVLVKKQFGLRRPSCGSHIVEEGRAVLGIVDVPGHRAIAAASIYLAEGGKMGKANRRSLDIMGKAIRAQGEECMAIVGGDYQNDPRVVGGSKFPEDINAVVVAANTQRGTYRSANAASNLDLFTMSKKLAAALAEVRLCEGTGIKGHVPVQIQFHPRPVGIQALTMRFPRRIPQDSLYGPLEAELDWSSARRMAEDALEEARRGGRQVQNKLNIAYDSWMNMAEEDLARITGHAPTKWGERGKRPRLRWAPILPERNHDKPEARASMVTWIKGAAVECRRIAKVLEEETGDGLYHANPWRVNMPHGGTFATPVRGGYGNMREDRGANVQGGRPRPPRCLKQCREVV